MNKFFHFSVAIFLAGCFFTFTGCREKKKSDIIITHKPVKKINRTISKVGDYKQERDVEWLGTNYKVTVEPQPDSRFAIVYDGNGSKFYDNAITLEKKRKDGSVFFSRTFKKADFDSKVDDIYKKNSVLLGIVLDVVEGNRLVFAASVGSPDKMSDEYVPLVLKIDNLGGVAISKDSQLDTGSDRVTPTGKKTEVELSEEEGV